MITIIILLLLLLFSFIIMVNHYDKLGKELEELNNPTKEGNELE